MISRRRYFEIAIPSVPEPVVDAWRTLVSVLSKSKCLPKSFYLSQIAGHEEPYHSERLLRLDSKEIESLIVERNLSGFRVNTGHSAISVDYSLSHMKESGRQSVLNCRIENKANAPDDWTPLIEAMMIQWPCIGGWQWDHLYRMWQWMSSEAGYERNFGPIPPMVTRHIKKSVDEIGADRDIVDISMNPGRMKELLVGVHFYPTAEMWLGPHFWQYASCSKEKVLAANFFIEKRDTPHFLYLKCWPRPFTRPDGEQGRMQQRIWKLFFHEDCEWPPGSGTISDEPVYGPPDLMPGQA